MRGDSYKLVGFALGKTALFALVIGVIFGLFVGGVIFAIGFMGSELLAGESSGLFSQGAFMLGLLFGGSSFVIVFFLIMILATLYNLVAELGAGLNFNLEDDSFDNIKPISL